MIVLFDNILESGIVFYFDFQDQGLPVSTNIRLGHLRS